MSIYRVQNASCHTYPIVVSIPHSGTDIPDSIRRQMLPSVILPNMDWHLPQLYSFLADRGVTVLTAAISRYVVDVNREPAGDCTGDYHNLVYQATTFGRPMYQTPLSQEEIQQRIRQYYRPYHETLQALLQEKLHRFPKVYLLDLHSFAQFADDVPADVILSNQHGASCLPETMQIFRSALEQHSYSVSENRPFAGGYITRHFGTRWGNQVEALQMELRYNQYLESRAFGEEEITQWDTALFSSAQKRLSNVFGMILPSISKTSSHQQIGESDRSQLV